MTRLMMGFLAAVRMRYSFFRLTTTWNYYLLHYYLVNAVKINPLPSTIFSYSSVLLSMSAPGKYVYFYLLCKYPQKLN